MLAFMLRQESRPCSFDCSSVHLISTLCSPLAIMWKLTMYLKIDRRIGYENQKKGTSNRIWQANAFIGTKIALYMSLFICFVGQFDQ